jgi:hypothetical protein
MQVGNGANRQVDSYIARQRFYRLDDNIDTFHWIPPAKKEQLRSIMLVAGGGADAVEEISGNALTAKHKLLSGDAIRLQGGIEPLADSNDAIGIRDHFGDIFQPFRGKRTR